MRPCALAWLPQNFFSSPHVPGTNQVLQCCLAKCPEPRQRTTWLPDPSSPAPSALQLSTLHWGQVHPEELQNSDSGVPGQQPGKWIPPADQGSTSFTGSHETGPQEWLPWVTLTRLKGEIPGSELLRIHFRHLALNHM